MVKRLLSVHAHPDDESSKGAATVARYRDEGVEIMVVSCTGGEAGDILNPAVEALPIARRDLPGLRRREMAAARDILGVEHRWLGYVDSGMPSDDGSLPDGSFAAVPLEISSRPLIRLIREFRPQVVVTYNEQGGYPHPDHIRTHEVTMAAVEGAATSAYPELGEPWRVQKVYFDEMFNAPRMRAVRDHLASIGADAEQLQRVDEMLERFKDRPERATTHVLAGDYFEVRDRALLSHASQVAPDAGFFFWPNDVLRAAWPYEDFELARSSVTSDESRGDLFDGVDLDDDAVASASGAAAEAADASRASSTETAEGAAR